MSGHGPRRSISRLSLAVLFLAATLGAWLAVPASDAAALSRWTGGVDLYRSGTFTTQRSWLWCTAADVQIIRNIADHRRDHSTAAQQTYFRYMRARNRYDIPVSDGVDPAGWTAGLRHYVDGRYRLVASRSFNSALRSAVTNLRRTGLPVGITVARGNHAWVLTGFTATADPARTSKFTVTSVRVVGPLWGLQSRSYGYDMRPDRKLTPAQLRGFFTPWHYAKVKMVWEDRWVSIQPIGRATTSAPAATTTPKPTAKPTPKSKPTPTSTPTAEPTAPPTPSPTILASPPSFAPPSDPAIAAAAIEPDPSAETGIPASTATGATGSIQPSIVLALISVLALGASLALRWRTDRPKARR